VEELRDHSGEGLSRSRTARASMRASRNPSARISMPEPIALRPASTVVIMRPGARGVEVLMLQRPLKMAAFAGAWVFPGGKLDAADSSARAAARLAVAAGDAPFREVRDHSGRQIDAAHARAYWCAACRETFEESGILLAERRDGSPCDRAQLGHCAKRDLRYWPTGSSFTRRSKRETSLFLRAR